MSACPGRACLGPCVRACIQKAIRDHSLKATPREPVFYLLIISLFPLDASGSVVVTTSPAFPTSPHQPSHHYTILDLHTSILRLPSQGTYSASLPTSLPGQNKVLSSPFPPHHH